MNRTIAALALAVALSLPAVAQDRPAPVGTVTNSFTLLQETLRQVALFVTISVTYPDNLEEDKYVDLVTVSQDVQGFLRGYPNRNAALEVFAAKAAIFVMDKYPQMTGVSIAFSNSAGSVQVTSTRTIPSASTAAKAAIQAELERALNRLPRN